MSEEFERLLFLPQGEAEWAVNAKKKTFSFPFGAVGAFQNALKVLKHLKKSFFFKKGKECKYNTKGRHRWIAQLNT